MRNQIGIIGCLREVYALRKVVVIPWFFLGKEVLGPIVHFEQISQSNLKIMGPK